MKKVLKHKLLFLLILTTMLLVLSLGTNQILKHYNVVEQKELTAPANWYEDYTYELDETNHTITLKKYNGSASELVVPSSAVIDGVTYNTIIEGRASSSTLLFSNHTNLTKITFENGIKAKGSLAYMFYNCKNLETIIFNDFDTTNVTSMEGLFYSCLKLKNVDITMLNTANVNNFK